MKTNRLLAASISLLVSISASASAQTETDKNFQALISDRKPHNCERAVLWLMARADTLQERLLRELYATTDYQCRDAILHILFNSPSFTPDDRFCRQVIARLPEQNRRVKNHTIFNSENVETDRTSEDGAHWEAWKFMNAHFDSFAPLLRELVATTDNEWVVWGAAWLLKHRDILEQNRDWFTPAVLNKAAANLKNDGKKYNASQAVRLFLLLGEQSLPVLQEASKSSDPQARDLAQATLDALEGSHNAMGFLTARVDPDEVLFGDQPEGQDWMEEAIEPYYENTKPYQRR